MPYIQAVPNFTITLTLRLTIFINTRGYVVKYSSKNLKFEDDCLVLKHFRVTLYSTFFYLLIYVFIIL